MTVSMARDIRKSKIEGNVSVIVGSGKHAFENAIKLFKRRTHHSGILAESKFRDTYVTKAERRQEKFKQSRARAHKKARG